ncbi:transglutaminase family protein [Plantibacter flavus]|uniref:transglutaminase-like domain-containing protein n=1 Tax=Plantibacter flavus TaxID=150123 RepID=UPI003F18627A
MQRTLTASLDLRVHDRADLIFSIAAAGGTPLASERLQVHSSEGPCAVTELVGPDETRLHRVIATPGLLRVEYEAVVVGHAVPRAVDVLETMTYLRPSRYCESDVLFSLARAELGYLLEGRRLQADGSVSGGTEALAWVAAWVGRHLSYVSGSTTVSDSAVSTLASGQGVCRDFAHLTIAMLRALDIPARYASVYAPGLVPMDFHAVAEGFVDGAWHVVDATGLAPRQSLVRIATGRDAADVAWLSNHHGNVSVDDMRIDAVIDVLPVDDPAQPVLLA